MHADERQCVRAKEEEAAEADAQHCALPNADCLLVQNAREHGGVEAVKQREKETQVLLWQHS